MASYMKSRGWTRLEMKVWLFALAFVIIGGTLLVTGIAGHWVLFLLGAIPLALGLMRYRAEFAQKRGSADDQASD